MFFNKVIFRTPRSLNVAYFSKFFCYYSWLGSRFKNINQLMKTSILKNSQVKTEDSDTESIFEPNHNFRNTFELDNWLPQRTVKVLQVNSTNNTRKLKQRSLSDDKIRLLQRIR